MRFLRGEAVGTGDCLEVGGERMRVVKGDIFGLAHCLCVAHI